MGDIADSMLNGEMCAECGVYLEPNETVYNQYDPTKKVKMPSDGEGVGYPVLCQDCKD